MEQTSSNVIYFSHQIKCSLFLRQEPRAPSTRWTIGGGDFVASPGAQAVGLRSYFRTSPPFLAARSNRRAPKVWLLYSPD